MDSIKLFHDYGFMLKERRLNRFMNNCYINLQSQIFFYFLHQDFFSMVHEHQEAVLVFFNKQKQKEVHNHHVITIVLLVITYCGALSDDSLS